RRLALVGLDLVLVGAVVETSPQVDPAVARCRLKRGAADRRSTPTRVRADQQESSDVAGRSFRGFNRLPLSGPAYHLRVLSEPPRGPQHLSELTAAEVAMPRRRLGRQGNFYNLAVVSFALMVVDRRPQIFELATSPGRRNHAGGVASFSRLRRL